MSCVIKRIKFNYILLKHLFGTCMSYRCRPVIRDVNDMLYFATILFTLMLPGPNIHVSVFNQISDQ